MAVGREDIKEAIIEGGDTKGITTDTEAAVEEEATKATGMEGEASPTIKTRGVAVAVRSRSLIVINII